MSKVYIDSSKLKKILISLDPHYTNIFYDKTSPYYINVSCRTIQRGLANGYLSDKTVAKLSKIIKNEDYIIDKNDTNISIDLLMDKLNDIESRIYLGIDCKDSIQEAYSIANDVRDEIIKLEKKLKRLKRI